MFGVKDRVSAQKMVVIHLTVPSDVRAYVPFSPHWTDCKATDRAYVIPLACPEPKAQLIMNNTAC